jgi:CheY-like chemotaxis protein
MPSESFSPGLDVLVVDDDPLTRTLMKRLLTRLGCSVATAENGALALEMILGGAIDQTVPASPTDGSVYGPIVKEPRWYSGEMKYAVIFLDNQMPVLSGLNTVRRLRELNRREFVVGVTGESSLAGARLVLTRSWAMSGNALLTDQKEYLEAGADQCVIRTDHYICGELIVICA